MREAIKVTRQDRAEALVLIDTVEPMQGETRVVYKCGDCGKLFVRRFIPYGLGYGGSWGMCHCQLVGRVNNFNVLERTP